MGAAEEQTPAKPSKSTSSGQETPTTMPPYPDWSSSMQAYYGGATPPFFASPVASPAPHPYMWGGQHPMMPPYGTPVHYPALYPPGGVYPPPNIGMAASAMMNGPETDGKHSDVRDQASAKKSKGNSGIGNEKVTETGKTASGSGNEGVSQSAESGSEGSSDASDENNNHQELSAGKKGANAQSNDVNSSIQTSVLGKPVVPIPTPNLNIGMDLWNSSSTGAAVKLRPSSGVSSAVAPVAVGHEGLMPDHQWVQDERELKRQKRKQSNRESARRSRLRKQAECEELQRRVQSLNNENSNLRDELDRLAAECKKLTSENGSIKDELTQVLGPDAVSGFGEKNLSGEENS